MKTGATLDYRVGRHLGGAAEVIKQMGEFYPQRSGLSWPTYGEVMEKGSRAFLHIGEGAARAGVRALGTRARGMGNGLGMPRADLEQAITVRRQNASKGRNPRGVTKWGPACAEGTPKMRFAGLRERGRTVACPAPTQTGLRMA